MHLVSRVLTLLLVLAAAPAGATTYVMMSDRALADGAPVIAEVTVLAVDAAPATRLPSTDYMVQLERLVKGAVPGSALIVRVPGGVGASGRGLRIWGAPQFAEGERALLFLSPREDGTYGISQLMLGAFHERYAGGVRLAVRHLEEATRVDPEGNGETGASDAPRSFDRFAAWLEDRAAGVEREADYFLPRAAAGALQAQPEPFKLIKHQGTPIRWFDFDSNGSVRWLLHQAGTDGKGGGANQLRNALGLWSGDTQSNVQLVYGGTTSAAAGFTNYEQGGDGLNVVLFEDPNDEIPDFFSCSEGGVLAIGGPGFDTASTLLHNGTAHFAALEAEIITNDGTACFFVNLTCAEEVFAHELGHTLGLGHSCGDAGDDCVPGSAADQALMRASIHRPCQGAFLGSDDRNGLRSLYGTGGGGGGKLPKAPSELTAVAAATDAIQLAWKDNANNETSFVVERKASQAADFSAIATLGPNTTSFTVTGLSIASIHTFRVRAVNAKGSSAFSNEAVGMTFALIAACPDLPGTLCLNGGRFQVEATWETVDGDSGAATAVPLTDDTGLFWFFDSDNVELVVKVLNACGINVTYWVFASGLTNVEVILTVVDTQTGAPRVYRNPQETPFAPVQDTSAFATCP